MARTPALVRTDGPCALLTAADFGLPNLIEERLNLSSLPAFLSAMIPAWPLQGHHRYDTTWLSLDTHTPGL